MQETLLGELSAARQVQLHGRIAEALEALYGEAPDTLRRRSHGTTASRRC